MSTDRFRAGYRGTLKKILTTPVVLEVGWAYSRAGFAGENAPRAVFANRFRTPRDAPVEEWAAELDEFARRLFYAVLLVNPKERRLAVLENPSTPWALKEALVAALFRHGVPHVIFLPAQHLAAVAASRRDGLVVDVGFGETRAVPLADGVEVAGAAVEVPVGMADVHARFRELAGIKPARADVDVADLVARLCFARPLPADSVVAEEKAAAAAAAPHLPDHVWGAVSVREQPQPADVRVRVSAAGDEVAVPAIARSHAADALFEPCGASPKEASAGEAVLEALLRCPADARSAAASGLLLVGGGSAVPGLAARLMEEVENLMALPRYAELRAYRRGIAVRRTPFPTTTAAWVGGSVVASYPLDDRAFLSREDYEAGRRQVPDWARARPAPITSVWVEEEEATY